MNEPKPEVWLRRPAAHVHPLIAPSLYGFQQAREDLDRFTAGLTDAEIWRELPGVSSVGFQLKHIAGSVDRLVTYLRGRPLSEEQLQFLRQEKTPGPGRDALLAALDKSLSAAEAAFQAIRPEQLAEPRYVGRKWLPTTVIGLLVHIAEHTQRHVGQAIIVAKLVRVNFSS